MAEAFGHALVAAVATPNARPLGLTTDVVPRGCLLVRAYVILVERGGSPKGCSVQRSEGP